MSHCGLYVHIPYCTSKCGYCDFYSVALEGETIDPFMDALLEELGRRIRSCPHRIETIFVGGGTPTVLPIRHLETLMGAVGEIARAHEPIEFTVEANPGTVNDEKLQILTQAGVDRLSMGAQSFLENELHWLQRDHSPADIAPSVALARKHGLHRLNLDLIFGIGCQTMESWDYSLDRALELKPDHLSCYGLTYEPGTAMTAMLHRGQLTPCDEELEAEMFLHTVDRLTAAGFEQYEISNYARPGQRCLHNLIYWRNEPYIGVGPSAAGYLDGVRYKNVSNIRRYVEGIMGQGHAVVETEKLTGPSLAGETAMLALRTLDGIDVDRFEERTGIDPRRAFARSFARFADDGMLSVTDEYVRLTRRGILLADEIIVEMLAELDGPPSKISRQKEAIPLPVLG